MKTWKKLSLAVATGLTALTLAACGKQSETIKPGTLTVGMEGTYAPYAYKDSKGKLTGFEVQLSKDVAQKMGMKVQYKLTGWDSLIAGLNSGTYDVIFNNMAINPARKKQYLFATPYAYDKSALITKKGSKIKPTDLKGIKIGAGTGTDNYNYAQKLGANVVSVPDFQTGMDMINQGRVKAAINSESAFNFWKKSHKNTDLTYTAIPTNIIPEAAIAPMMNKKSTKLQKQMDKALGELQKDGTIKKLSIKYFGKDMTEK